MWFWIFKNEGIIIWYFKAIGMMPSRILNLSLKYLSVFSPNAKKYGPEKTPYLDTFYAVYATFAAYINIEINAWMH